MRKAQISYFNLPRGWNRCWGSARRGLRQTNVGPLISPWPRHSRIAQLRMLILGVALWFLEFDEKKKKNCPLTNSNNLFLDGACRIPLMSVDEWVYALCVYDSLYRKRERIFFAYILVKNHVWIIFVTA